MPVGIYPRPEPNYSNDFVGTMRKAIRDRRESLGLTIGQACGLAHVAKSPWQKFESKGTNPSFDTFWRMATVLGLEIRLVEK